MSLEIKHVSIRKLLIEHSPCLLAINMHNYIRIVGISYNVWSVGTGGWKASNLCDKIKEFPHRVPWLDKQRNQAAS